jgi:hypothetical protein
MRATFEGLPDAPVTSFAMTLFGGKRGLLQNAENACQGVHPVNARFVAQSNTTSVSANPLLAKCPKHRRGHKSKKRTKAGHHR